MTDEEIKEFIEDLNKLEYETCEGYDIWEAVDKDQIDELKEKWKARLKGD